MKIAIVHDYIKEYGGAERVLEAFLEIWPEADVYTLLYSPKYLGPHRSRVEKWNIKTSILQKIPFKEKLISYFRVIGPWVFRAFDLSKYDVVLVSAAGTYTSPNFIKTGKKILHVCYCHTPPRYLYGYSTAQDWGDIWWRKILRAFGTVPMHFLRIADFKSAQRPDYFVANSREVADRIQKFYRRDSTVIYAPVDIPEGIKPQPLNQREYYLAGGRLARPKRIDLAIKAANKLKIPLKVFGKEFAGYGRQLREMAGPTVEFLGEISDEEKLKLMAGAKAFIFPADEEDFGITPVEAMGVGTPVIAYKSGGVVESVIEGKTGTFFDKPTTESLSVAVRKFEKMKFDPKDCIDQAKKFSKERFKKEMREFIQNHAKKNHR